MKLTLIKGALFGFLCIWGLAGIVVVFAIMCSFMLSFGVVVGSILLLSFIGILSGILSSLEDDQ